MRKLANNSGMTLIELLAALAILVVLVMGMGATMDAGVQVYQEAIFESDSAALAGILNSSLGDILRYSTEIDINEGTEADLTHAFVDSSGTYILKDQVGFVFTNYEYGIRDAYFYTPVFADNTSKGVLQMRNLKNPNIVELVNSGAYPDLVVSNFKIICQMKDVPGSANEKSIEYFTVTYDIFHESNPELSRKVSTVIRLMNEVVVKVNS